MNKKHIDQFKAKKKQPPNISTKKVVKLGNYTLSFLGRFDDKELVWAKNLLNVHHGDDPKIPQIATLDHVNSHINVSKLFKANIEVELFSDGTIVPKKILK